MTEGSSLADRTACAPFSARFSGGDVEREHAGTYKWFDIYQRWHGLRIWTTATTDNALRWSVATGWDVYNHAAAFCAGMEGDAAGANGARWRCRAAALRATDDAGAGTASHARQALDAWRQPARRRTKTERLCHYTITRRRPATLISLPIIACGAYGVCCRGYRRCGDLNYPAAYSELLLFCLVPTLLCFLPCTFCWYATCVCTVSLFCTAHRNERRPCVPSMPCSILLHAHGCMDSRHLHAER